MEVLQLAFFQHALIASILVSITCGIIGVYVVINRMVFLSGAIAHGAYGGVGIAFFLGVAPLLGGGVFALFLAFLIGVITLKDKHNADAIVGASWAFGMAVGIIFTDITPGYNVDLMSYLFGGILAVSDGDIYAMSAVTAIVFVVTSLLYRKLQAMSFDSEFASLRGVKVHFLYFLLLALISLCIIVSVRAVGLILVIALLTIPPYIAKTFAKHLHVMILISTILSLVLCVSGLFISYFLNVSSGACIILLSSVVFFMVLVYKKILG